MMSLADLRARNVLPMWQEGVAVVQELLHTVIATQGSAERLPDLEHVALIANGDVVALPGSPVSHHPVRHLAILLQLLLEGVPVPPELQSFIEKNVADPPQFTTVEEFSRQLAYFERPGRKADVERLVARATASESQTRAEEELRRLKEKAQQAAETAPADRTNVPHRRKHRVPLPVLAAAVVFAAAAGVGAWWWLRSLPPATAAAATAEAPAATATPASTSTAASTPAGSATAPTTSTSDVGANEAVRQDASSSFLDRTRSAVSRVVHTAMEKIAGPSEPKAAAAPVEVAPEPAPARRRGSRAHPAPSSIATTQPKAGALAPAAAPVVPVTATEISGALAPPAVALALEPSLPTSVPSIIYAPGDPGVEPAVMVRPVLPKEPPPDVPADQVGTLEVVVDEQGDVEQVKLMSPANRFHERMLVSAAKMWKFRPAMKDGHPVRYRTRVRLTI